MHMIDRRIPQLFIFSNITLFLFRLFCSLRINICSSMMLIHISSEMISGNLQGESVGASCSNEVTHENERK